LTRRLILQTRVDKGFGDAQADLHQLFVLSDGAFSALMQNADQNLQLKQVRSILLSLLVLTRSMCHYSCWLHQ